MLKVTLFFSSTILKYWRDLFSLEILKNARVTCPTHDNGLGVSGGIRVRIPWKLDVVAF